MFCCYLGPVQMLMLVTLDFLLHVTALKPNSIMLAGSELVRSWFEAGSCQIPLHWLVRSWLRTSLCNGIWSL